MTILARLLVSSALVATSLAASAAPARYALDPVHTRVLFAVEHAGFSKALGTVSGSSGTLVFDPDDWAAARLDVTVPLHRADLGDAKWNQATLARNLLDAERFPDAHFVSTHVEASGENHAKVTGNLTLHGVTRPVTLDVTLGDSVELRIEAEAVREGRADDEPPEPQAAPTPADSAATQESGT
ncbi:YceI family protein [Xanthomonas citri pv. bilvae]|uniref:YceI family protein n=1 Tax=Xanthomonas citri TaxID=346 RepID=UPI0030C7BA1F